MSEKDAPTTDETGDAKVSRNKESQQLAEVIGDNFWRTYGYVQMPYRDSFLAAWTGEIAAMIDNHTASLRAQLANSQEEVERITANLTDLRDEEKCIAANWKARHQKAIATKEDSEAREQKVREALQDERFVELTERLVSAGRFPNMSASEGHELYDFIQALHTEEPK